MLGKSLPPENPEIFSPWVKFISAKCFVYLYANLSKVQKLRDALNLHHKLDLNLAKLL